MKLTVLGALALAAVVAVGCERNAVEDGDGDGVRTDRETIGTSGTPGEGRDRDGLSLGIGPRDPREFVQEVSTVNHAEVVLAKLAMERAQSADVKQFAQMMIRDHTRAGKELASAVARHNVHVTASLDDKHQALNDRLRNLRGAEFDREYMNAMVDGHEHAGDLIESKADDRRPRATGTSGAQADRPADSDEALDMAVSQWATKTLFTVERHLERAREIRAGLSGGNAGANQGRTSTGSHHQDTAAETPSKPKY
jgi:putative membrane protein